MNYDFYKSEMDRLIKNFGNASYTTDRLGMIHKIVVSLTNEEFKRIINNFIGYLRKPPLIPEFQEAVRESKQKHYNEEILKRINRKRKVIYEEGNIIEMFDMLEKTLKGKYTNKELEDYLEIMKSQIPDDYFSCNKCKETGLVFENDGRYENVYKCNCMFGVERKEKYPFARDLK